MELVPTQYRKEGIKHFVFSAATVGSNSYAAPGTGLAYMPVFAWGTASAVGSMRYTNGTGGSTLFTFKMQAGGFCDIRFWEEPSKVLANQCAVLISDTNGIGVNEFHVWALPVRAGAGQDALGQ